MTLNARQMLGSDVEVIKEFVQGRGVEKLFEQLKYDLEDLMRECLLPPEGNLRTLSEADQMEMMEDAFYALAVEEHTDWVRGYIHDQELDK